MSRRIADLHPAMQFHARHLMSQCRSQLGLDLLVYCTRRSYKAQAGLWTRGRYVSVGSLVNVKTITGEVIRVKAQPGRKVTWVRPGGSWHQYGLAFDCVPLLVGGKADWHYNPEDADDMWDEVGALGKECGLEWGGYWPKRKRDMPHFQLRGPIQGGGMLTINTAATIGAIIPDDLIEF